MSVLALIIDATLRLPTHLAKPQSIVRRSVSGIGDAFAFRLAYFAVSRLSPHLIRDMGLDPDDLKASFRQRWRTTGRAMPNARAADAFADAEPGATRAQDGGTAAIEARADACAC